MRWFRKAGSREPKPVAQTVVAPLSGLRFGRTAFSSYAELYRTQPAVRSVVRFLSENIAQVPLHAYTRSRDNERQRLPANNSLEALIHQPNGSTTGYRLVRDLVADIAVFDGAFLLKIRADGGNVTALVRIPPASVSVVTDRLTDGPLKFRVQYAQSTVDYEPSEIVHFSGYNPTGDRLGVSPLESLRSMLAEDYAAATQRESFWQNGARHDGVIERPLEAPPWDGHARKNFADGVKARYTGTGPGAGFPLVLEEGMTYKQEGFSPRDSEYVAGRQLTLSFCASVYGIPAQLIGASGTDRNWSEAHRALYQDVLPPWTRLIEDELQLQLVPDVLGDFATSSRTFLEFSLEEKLRGSFREQSEVFTQAAAGAAWMTPNEIRRLLNMPSIPGGDELAERVEPQAASIHVSPPNVNVDVAPPAVQVQMPPQAKTRKVVKRDKNKLITSIEEEAI